MSAAQLSRPHLGELAPTITLEGESVRTWRLEDQRGQTVVLIFHRHIH